MSRGGRSAWAALVLLALAGATEAATPTGRTRTWSDPASRLGEGDAEGVAVTQRGLLFLAPRLERMGDGPTAGEPLHIWAMASDERGNIYLGTGPAGRIVKVSPGGEQSVFFSVDEPMVTALTFSAAGDLLAGTVGGHVYRIRPDGSGERWCETDERYVWSLAVSPRGEVFAGTGEQGSIFRIDRSGNAELFYDTDETHIVRLHALDDGTLVAGSAGSSGLIYRIDREANAVVLHDDDLPEVAALLPQADGAVVAAFLAPPPAESKRPAVRIRLPDGARVGGRGESVGGLEEESGPVLRGEIEGLPGAADAPAAQLRGRVLRVAADGQTTEL